MELKGKVALITGGARGIGRATALRLAKLGADIVINDINLKSAKEFQEELTADTVMEEVKNLGCRSIGMETDITNKRAVISMVDEIRKEFGDIDILVNNAGGSQSKKGPLTGDSASLTEEDFHEIENLNLMGTIFCCQAVTPSMIMQKWGRIVNISSIVGLMVKSDNHSFATKVAYCVSKASVIHYTRVLAAELGPHGIRVNCASPAAVATERTKFYSKKGFMVSEAGMKDCPLGRPAVADDIAKAVQFLCTDLSDYITGQCIRVDGGRSLF